MNSALKAICLGLCLLVLVGTFAELPYGLSLPLRYAALVLLAGHLVEIVVASKSIKLYDGPIAVSVLLTVLFGFLHWFRWPGRMLARRSERRSTQ